MMTEADDPGAGLRAFVALRLPEEVCQNVSAAQAMLKKTGAHVGWVPAENFHVSLFFLGNIPVDWPPRLAHIMDAVAAETARFTFLVAGLAVFGSPLSPRVVWAGIVDSGGMVALHNRLRPHLEALGLAREARAFCPHITLGRVRSPRKSDALMQAIQMFSDTAFGEVVCVDVYLMRSRLQPDGVRYSILHRAVFGQNG